MPKFGISIYCISRKIVKGEITPVEAYHKLCEYGAEAVELVPFGFNIATNPELIEQFKEAYAQTGVPFTNYSLNGNFLGLTCCEFKGEIARAKQHIDAASKLGITTFRMDSAAFRRPIRENTIENFQKEVPVIVSAYQELCDYASKYNMTILMENHGFHANGADRVRQIMVSVNRDNFGHQLDVGNYTCVDDIPEIAVKKMIRFAKTIHMKDFYIRPEHKNPGDSAQFDCENSWFRSVGGSYLRGSILAQGDIDIWDVTRTIKQSGFDGIIYLEYEGMEECEYGTRVSFDNMKRIWNEV
ncbi:MAG: sugar phosphate isomerase/epimerase [Clostridia bacterium]|nr:sugar phosphate isomerase/epimerase [Clostridia bacterium]